MINALCIAQGKCSKATTVPPPQVAKFGRNRAGVVRVRARLVVARAILEVVCHISGQSCRTQDKLNRSRANVGRFRPNVGRIRATEEISRFRVEFGRTEFGRVLANFGPGPNLAEFGKMRLQFGRTRRTSGRVRAKLADVRQTLSQVWALCPTNCPEFERRRPASAEFGFRPHVARFGQTSACSPRTWTGRVPERHSSNVAYETRWSNFEQTSIKLGKMSDHPKKHGSNEDVLSAEVGQSWPI